jgi:hypothetical protein
MICIVRDLKNHEKSPETGLRMYPMERMMRVLQSLAKMR